MSNRLLRRVASLAVVAVVVGAAGCTTSDDEGTPPSSPTTAGGGGGPTAPGPTGDGLTVGVLRPATGLLDELFAAQERGIALAAADIADGGGVLGGPLTVEPIDVEPGSTVVEALGDGVGDRPLIGPAGSTSALLLKPELPRLGTTACSASATLAGLTEGQDTPLLFRTVVGDDVMVARVADLVAERRAAAGADQPFPVAVVHRGDEYGTSVAAGLTAGLSARGIDAAVTAYHPFRVAFGDLAAQVAASAPKLTVLVSYEEGPLLLGALLRNRMDPATVIGLDGFLVPRLGEVVAPADPTTVDGFTAVGTGGDRAFLDRLAQEDPRGQAVYAAQAYDCAITLALAAEAMALDGDLDRATAVRDVTAGGTTCSTYGDCRSKLAAGEDIDYDGPSGRLAIDATGTPTAARLVTARWQGGALAEVSTDDIDLGADLRDRQLLAAAVFTAQVQAALTLAGFAPGPIDGVWDDDLTAAVSAFQQSAGVPVTGVWDADTDEAMRSRLGGGVSALQGTTAELQRLLIRLGYEPGEPDGVWRAATTEALKAFQRDLGVPDTGVLDQATVKAIYDKGVGAGVESVPPATTVPPTTAPATTTPTSLVPAPLPTLLSLIEADPELSTLRTALEAAGFAEGGQPGALFTLFAPTNDAFERLPAGQLDALLADPPALRALLAYHVVPGVVLGAQLRTGDVPTLHGAPMAVQVPPADQQGLRVVVGGTAAVTGTDGLASDGVVHRIDAVLTPPPAA